MRHRVLHTSETLNKQSSPYSSIIGVVITCDDERFIGSLILSIRSQIDELVVVDDGSVDNTASIARYAGATILNHDTHKGRLAAANTGLQHVKSAGTATVLVLDGNSDYNADDVTQIMALIETGDADIVLGVRADDSNDGTTASDARTTIYALAPNAVERLTFDPHGASFEQQIAQIASREGLRITTLALAKPVLKKRAQPARPQWRLFKVLVRTVGEDRPLLFFGLSGVVVFILGILLGAYTTRIYADTGILAIGYGLLTVLLCVVGTILFFAGIILHSTRAMMTELRRSLQLHGVGTDQTATQVIMPGDEILLGDAPRSSDSSTRS